MANGIRWLVDNKRLPRLYKAPAEENVGYRVNPYVVDGRYYWMYDDGSIYEQHYLPINVHENLPFQCKPYYNLNGELIHNNVKWAKGYKSIFVAYMKAAEALVHTVNQHKVKKSDSFPGWMKGLI